MALTLGNNYTLLNPVGVDAAIQRVQILLSKKLDWQYIQLFGRAEKVPLPESKTGLKPMLYYGNNEYKEVMRDDNYFGQVFFVVANQQTTKEGVMYKANCKIVFMLNLAKIYANQPERADAKAQEEVMTALKSTSSFLPISIGTGIKESLGEFDTEDIKFTDVHPNHCFCVNGTLSYQISCYN